jgi:hypothetical protein
MRKVLYVAMAMTLAGSARAEERPIKLEEVPPLVMQTAKAAMPGVVFGAAQIDTYDTETIYELKGKLPDGKQVEIDVYPDGFVEEIEIIIEKSDVPGQVMAFFDKRFPGFKVTKIEKSIRPCRNGLKTVWYEFDGITAQGEAVDIEVDENATKYLVEPD